MKKWICMMLTLLMVVALAACSGSGQGKAGSTWSREGTFEDENGDFLSVTASDSEENPGWYVGVMLENEMHGWYIQQEGNTLHGNLVSEYEEEGEFIVTISEEGEDGLRMVVEGGDTYHFTPVEE